MFWSALRRHRILEHVLEDGVGVVDGVAVGGVTVDGMSGMKGGGYVGRDVRSALIFN